MGSDKETTDPRYYGLEHAVVVNNQDPLNLQRVTVRVPGIIDGESGWAMPCGAPGGGGPQRGLFIVPAVGAEVCVWFHRGDPNGQIHYTPGNWGTPGGNTEAPSPLAAAAAGEQTAIVAFETDRWLMTYDERPGKEFFRIEDKLSGDKLELDGHAMGATIQITSNLSVKCAGTVDIEALNVQVGGRQVVQNGKPIQ